MTALSIRCPHCEAAIGESCVDDDGDVCNPHKARITEAASAAGIVEGAMRARSALEVAWINVVLQEVAQ